MNDDDLYFSPETLERLRREEIEREALAKEVPALRAEVAALKEETRALKAALEEIANFKDKAGYTPCAACDCFAKWAKAALEGGAR